MLRRLVIPLAFVLLVAGCGSKAKESGHTRRLVEKTQPVKTTAIVPKGVAGVVHVKTNLGSFAFTLTPKVSPRATRSFARLVRKGFFNGLIFHRIVRDFVIQGGDPTGTGSGGPDYVTHDVVPPGTRYPLGTVAMAKTQVQPAGTAGSQFFVVTGNRGLDGPYYAVIGHVTSGMKVVLKIGRRPADPNGVPLKRVVMQRVTLTRS